ncbi:hypothetical protein WA026_011497 [Henosepilachna vigintioctopunctata]|uniref:Tetraspanin n=1 Tax=Henosepilachna vigintioctopunctata TaxID=420089 RepID=A0AAW1TKW8_9CUCU
MIQTNKISLIGFRKNGYTAVEDVGSREACGVPFSCCKQKPNEAIKNKQCGYDVRKPGFNTLQNLNATLIINERGCLGALEDWMEKNMIPIATYIFVYFFFHILGICFAQNLRADIFAQISKWRH